MSYVRIVTPLLLALAGLACRPGTPAPRVADADAASGVGSSGAPRLIVLGIDGMDPTILDRLASDGKMPAFRRLAAEGGYRRLGTTMPPQSPVAWSTFITGLDPGGHGIFDFLRHDHRTFAVAESNAFRKEPTRVLGLPLWGGGFENLRKGKAFWEHLEEAGVDATVIRVPSNFPPVGKTSRTLSGMGTPDLRGTNGTFTYYTTSPPADAADFSGGVVERVEVRDGVIAARLDGPPTDDAGITLASTPLTVYLGPDGPLARIDVGDERRVLAEGEWSDWVRVRFRISAGVGVSGIVRFYLKEVRPTFRLYASPVNIDPDDPAVPISTPSRLVRELSATVGPFYTQGMAEDTKGLEWGVLDQEEFAAQARIVLEESRRLLEAELARFRGRSGFLFFYISSIDQCSHMAWRTQDPTHPGWRPDFPPQVSGFLSSLYEEMDPILERVLEEVDGRTTLIVMSDHGFAPLYRVVHLNNWLAEEGYLALYSAGPTAGKRLASDADWSRTRAYAMGFNGIWLNLFGREPSGTVAERERGALLEEISSRLLAWRDPEGGKPIVLRTYRREEIYSGRYVSQAPDLVVGYARGYRASWDTPIGKLGPGTIEDNMEEWSGDHLMAAEEVPGVILSNRPLRKESPDLRDLAPTILEVFDIPRPAEMAGSSVFAEEKS